jgi:hypothetical protein
MKPTVITTAIMAIAIQGMMIGQTSGSTLRKLPELSEKKLSTQKSALPILISSEEYEKPVIRQTSNVLFTFTKDKPEGWFTRSRSEQLSEEASQILAVEQTLRSESYSDTNRNYKTLKQCSAFLIDAAIQKQLMSSEINGKLNRDQFSSNLIQITHLAFKLENQSSIYIYTLDKKQQCIQTMKLAQEMREEAYSLRNYSSILGVLLNAEEKESIALNNQLQLITEIKRALAFNQMRIVSELAIR